MAIAVLRGDKLNNNQQFYSTLKNTFIGKSLKCYYHILDEKKNQALEDLPNFFDHTR